ncbi:DDT domain-containing protein PTM isoform X2 [Manihot esculenta]|uniref:DDT domain-containing protein PTM isoform X2 n=1 Tax=Manihot esculenta TaxID=3983 RepID=UPI000B5D730D|nr:DDT domain-containing protein PTM isoform X2 [Manihot esculenta]
MEPTEVKKRGRGRPRKRRPEEDEIDEKVGFAIKKQALEMRWKPLVGRYLLKEFDGNGTFLGKIVSYDTGLYRVDYEDGDSEDLESGDLRQLILGDDDFDDVLNERKKKLDQLVLEKSLKNKKNLEKEVAKLKNEVDKVETSAITDLSGQAAVENDEEQGEGDADSSSDSCEYALEGGWEPEAKIPTVPPPQLPPSSGTVGVPEECVSLIFSVYGFLRSFNVCLFLSPFTLDDLVGAVNCNVQNTLLDAIHVALMHALRRHLETISSDGSDIASKCLRCVDWSLLDSLTWPVYLVRYFTVMGYAKGPEWKGFYDDLLNKEYYSLPVSRKLTILQILCDDVLDCAEIRAEIDMREESEVGIDPDAFVTNLPENGPRRVHPRYSKTSACKDREGMEIIAESHGTMSSCSSKNLGFKGSKLEGDGPGVDGDSNNDECRLCGMDGTLLCCDGCPSAYHSRCIGVVKMYIPEGPWYCPECTINKLGPTVVMGTSLRGAEIFGVDLYEQLFLGTCNHLLVIRSSIGAEPCLRYYSQKDIPKVLQVLSSSVQHKSLYLEISKAIAEYWKIPETAFFPFETMERNLIIPSINEDEKYSTLSVPFAFKEKHKVAHAGEAEDVISLNASNVDSVVVSCLDPSINTTIQAQPHGILSNGDAKNCHLLSMRLMEQIKVESTSSVNQTIDPSDVARHSFVDRSSMITSCTSANSDGNHIGHGNATSLPAISESKESNHEVFGGVDRNLMDNVVYVGTFFKPYSYINHYVHGYFAASAAANLAVLSSEGSRVSDTHKSANARKIISDMSLQIKAFSTAASRFFWPSLEKKLVEVPRERCGWCHSCKLPSNNRRGCMLNSAALTATKGTLKILNGLRPIMSGEGSLPSISTYILYMGEVLCGITGGPFMSTSFRKQWRKQIEDASTFSAIKGPLLELEENIRTIALFGDWAKAMDDWLVDSPVIQCSTSTIGTTQKRGPGGKRHRKQSGMSDIRDGGSDDKSFVWWRGGKLLKHVFLKASLPQPVVRRAARQGYCHKDCTIGTRGYMNEEVEFMITCKQCYNAKAVSLENSNESPTTPLPFQGQDPHNIPTATKITRIKFRNQPLVSIRTQESSSEMKQTTPSLASKNRNRLCSWGVIWMKKNIDTGIDFRRENILLKGNSESLKPVCNLCKKPYNRDLMYIHCETCNSWFHAEAVGLDESKLSDVVGFKCCRCRRIKSPKCPYDNPEDEKPVSHKPGERVLKKGHIRVGNDSGTVVRSKMCEPTTPMFPMEEVLVQEDDSLLSVSRFEQVTDNNSRAELEWNAAGQGPQKLPVRRHTKPQLNSEDMFENNHLAESCVPVDRNNLMNPKEELPSCAEWDVSNCLEGEVMFDYEGMNYEDMEFEPQTYFSFTELLASDDSGQLDGFDASVNVLGNSENQSCTVSHDGFLEQSAMDISVDQQELVSAPQSTINTKQCKMCLHSEPVPDLSCEICNLVIHSHCSPWVESSSPEGTWSCGNCREWR